jgi:hypothetical protein
MVTGPKFVPRALDDANLEFIEMQVGPNETQISPAEVCTYLLAMLSLFKS